MFNERKVAQMAAFLLEQGGKRFAHLKLMKLLYLADRESLDQYGYPLSGDKHVSMRHGPVLSCTLDLINGNVLSRDDGWEAWISDRENHEVAVRRDFTREELDELSDADIEILSSVWGKFGHMSKFEIRDYTHDNLPEWEDPNGSSNPIPVKRIFTALGRTPTEADELKANLEAESSIDRLFASL